MQPVQIAGFGLIGFINRFPKIKRGVDNPVVPMAGGDARFKNQDSKKKD